MIYVDSEKCAGCGVCEEVCPVEAIRVSDGVACIDQDRCNQCEACLEACPNEAILVVIEPVEEKAISLHEQPAPAVILTEPHRTKVGPVLGAALAFLGREVAPRLVTVLAEALDRRLSQQPNKVSPTSNLASSAPLSPPHLAGRKGEQQKGRRQRHRRRGK